MMSKLAKDIYTRTLEKLASSDPHFKMNLPPEVKEVFDILAAKGRKAYIAGGAVRDAVHGKGRIPKDYDWMVDASPEEMLKWIPNTRMNGRGVKYRADGKVHMDLLPMCDDLGDPRHPQPPHRTSDHMADLDRRDDFTFSTMAYSPKEGLIDPHNGAEDILAGRMVLNTAMGKTPEKLIANNPGIILKALSLNKRLGLEVPDDLKALMLKYRDRLENDWVPDRPDWVQRRLAEARSLDTPLAHELGF